MAARKTIFLMEVTNKEFNIQYSGKISGEKTKEQFKHDARLMRALYACPQALAFLTGIVSAVNRCKTREAKKGDPHAKV